MRAFWVVCAVAEIAALLTIAAPSNPDKPGRAGGIRTAAAQLRGSGPPIDLVQDYVGARDLVHGRDPYPVLTRAYAGVGLTWPVPHRSTHPPTAFLLVLPVAWLPWHTAAAVWLVLMLLALVAAYSALGLAAAPALALAPLTLVWPPGAWSMGQLTPVWLLGAAIAWRLRARPSYAGAAIALASLTKLVPVVLLLPFLLLRRWSVLKGFAAVWAVALAALLVLDPRAFTSYATVVRTGSRPQADRRENAALLWAGAHKYGVVGVVVACLLVVAVLVFASARVARSRDLDRWSWDGVNWIAVALLPIAWIYSLLPLLPTLVRSVRRGGAAAAGLALAAFTIPFLVDPFGTPGAYRLALATAMLGVSLLIGGRNAVRRASARERRCPSALRVREGRARPAVRAAVAALRRPPRA